MIKEELIYQKDKTMYDLLNAEYSKHRESIGLIASENFVSNAVLDMLGSIFANKLAEGYPGRRYNTGCRQADIAEELAISRVKKLFNCNYANVQPHSGSQANQAVFFALLNPGDTILGMSMDAGGHLTHGSAVNISGKWFKVVQYGVTKDSYLIDYNQIEDFALKYKPKLIIAGHSSYPRNIDFKEFKRISDRIGAYFLADIAHIAGQVVAGYHENPIAYADVVTSTTHKTLRGPRGGIILSNREDLFKSLDAAVFPGIQSAPLVNVIMAKAVVFGEALSDNFKDYIEKVILNAQVLARTLLKRGYDILTNGTDNHIVMIDLRSKNLTGELASNRLSLAGITCNKNSVPFDTRSPFVTSGIRLGTPACTTRGLGIYEFEEVGNIIADILDEISKYGSNATSAQLIALGKVKALASKFSLY